MFVLFLDSKLLHGWASFSETPTAPNTDLSMNQESSAIMEWQIWHRHELEAE